MASGRLRVIRDGPGGSVCGFHVIACRTAACLAADLQNSGPRLHLSADRWNVYTLCPRVLALRLVVAVFITDVDGSIGWLSFQVAVLAPD
jgi:hypothetical protein